MKTYPLKRCPFCGGKAEMKTVCVPSGDYLRIRCKDANCLMHSMLIIGTPEEIARRWNRRKDVNS